MDILVKATNNSIQPYGCPFKGCRDLCACTEYHYHCSMDKG